MLVVAALSDDADPNDAGTGSPLVARDDYGAPSVFRPESLLREARRQKGLTPGAVPPVCILDPDGDIVRLIRTAHGAWAIAALGLLPHGNVGVARRGGPLRHGGGRHRGVLRGSGGGAALRLGLRAAHQHHVCRADRRKPRGARLCPDRPGHPGRRHEPSLPRGRSAGGGRPPVDGSRRSGGSRDRLPAGPRHELDHGRAVPRNRPRRSRSDAVRAPSRSRWRAASLLAFAEARDCAVLCVAHVTNQLGVVEGRLREGSPRGRRTISRRGIDDRGGLRRSRQPAAAGRDGVKRRDGSVQDGGRLRNSA